MSPADRGGDVARLSIAFPGRAARSEIIAGESALDGLPDLLATHAPAHRYAVLADATVAGLHGGALVERLAGEGLRVELMTFPAGEAAKTAATWGGLVEAMADRGFGRDSCVIGLGGGVSTDLAGFVAATFMRGVPLVHLPSSLLAMIDAAIGGKSGVDLRAGKNLAGAFHQPRLVVADTALLRTLPDAELRQGMAEAIKHAAIADADHFDRLARDPGAVLGRQPGALGALVAESIRIKARFVAEDPLEGGIRAMLNFGHTIAHALERVTDYRIPHGSAVAAGMVAEALVGEAADVTAPGTADRVRELVGAFDLPAHRPPEAGLEAVMAATTADKKGRRGAVRYALLGGVGEPARGPDGAWTHAVDPATASAALQAW